MAEPLEEAIGKAEDGSKEEPGTSASDASRGWLGTAEPEEAQGRRKPLASDRRRAARESARRKSNAEPYGSAHESRLC